LLQWLSQNRKSLHAFQGEDVSAGIWLAPVHPLREDDVAWQCFGRCVPGMLASPQHSEEALDSLWRNFTRCGNPCECGH
jgi:hypothetical protein